MVRKKKEFERFKEVNVSMLNVRSHPSTTNGLITKIITHGTVVECDKNFDDLEWDHIITDPNIEGYCMKKFLTPITAKRLAELGKEPIIIHSMKYECDAAKEKKDDNEEDK